MLPFLNLDECIIPTPVTSIPYARILWVHTNARVGYTGDGKPCNGV